MVQGVVPVRGRDDVYRLVRDKIAWNMDGSVDARPRFGGSWIRYWEIKTGKNAHRRCSYVSCTAWAEDGGHVWIAGGNGAYIAPICKRCNWCENETRVQGSGSQLRRGTEVVLVDYTQSMRRADRRIALYESEGVRKSEMFSMVENQAKYLHDASGHMSADQLISVVETGSITGVNMTKELIEALKSFKCEHCEKAFHQEYERECRSCGVDISNRPPNFNWCSDCWRGGRGGRGGRGRRWKASN